MAAELSYTVAQAADALGCSDWLVRRLIARGRLPAVRLGDRRLAIPGRALEDHLCAEALAQQAERAAVRSSAAGQLGPLPGEAAPAPVAGVNGALPAAEGVAPGGGWREAAS